MSMNLSKRSSKASGLLSRPSAQFKTLDTEKKKSVRIMEDEDSSEQL